MNREKNTVKHHSVNKQMKSERNWKPSNEEEEEEKEEKKHKYENIVSFSVFGLFIIFYWQWKQQKQNKIKNEIWCEESIRRRSIERESKRNRNYYSPKKSK